MSCVIVLGLPRGGTSAVAGVIHRLGFNMGDKLMPAFEVNPKGFYEDMTFVNLHNRLMSDKDRDPREEYIVPEDNPGWDHYGQQIAVKSNQERWGVKDPKMCFFLKAFLGFVRGPVKIVHVQRRFHDSVHSYMKLWGGMSRDEAILRLGRYRYSLAKNMATVKDVPFFQVGYEFMCKHPKRTVLELARFLDVEPSPEAMEFIDPQLNRNGRVTDVTE
jgi:hypothetical protein